MSSNPRITPSPEIAYKHPDGIAKPEVKDLQRCFATFADLALESTWEGGLVFLNLAAEDRLGFSLLTSDSSLFNS